MEVVNGNEVKVPKDPDSLRAQAELMFYGYISPSLLTFSSRSKKKDVTENACLTESD